MKQSILLIALCIGFFSCNTETKPAETKTDSAVVKEALVYPFTPKYSLKWQPGDEKNALIVLNCLKHYTDGDVKGAFADFADTVTFLANKFHYRGTKDSLAALFTADRAGYASMSKVFDTWLTAYYPDKDDTWVTLWYTEITTDKKGKTDSLYYTDDVLIKNGKIQEYDEKQRQFPAPMAKK
jgi:hypothetical protein